ncbi:fluoride efflux transporter CrcB [Halomonas faecis]|uniref:fluoride efflux transporter CrcB n=1 Tax=Halomonas faecis TaxID=1562110 RepID=UPI0013D51E98|nr:fluoride efflux transporter CrcB [Halomonas faecis]
MSGWRAYAAVGLGSALGSLLRYLVSLALAGSSFPWATLAVNAIGSGMIVGLATYAARRHRGRVARWQPFLIAGFCGGFTTFSLFGLETLQLWQVGRSWLALSYVPISVAVWLTAAWLGHRLGQRAAVRS